ncbi:MAG: hypothetical protein ACRCYO_09730 [Bacteroidia bacterium]
MEIITDDLLVFETLEQVGRDGFDPLVSSVFAFSQEQTFFLFLFCPEGKHKGCRLYRFEEFPKAHEIRTFLIPDLLALPEDGAYTEIRTAALNEAERLLHVTSVAQFFDAH